MPTKSDESRYQVTAAHEMLLRLAGRVPDDLLSQCRAWLAAGAYGDIARSVVFVAIMQKIALSHEDIAVLAVLLEAAGGSTETLSEVDVVDDEPLLPYTFTAAVPGADARTADEVDRVALDTVRSQPGGLGLWRAWRHPADGSPWPPPRRVYLVEVEAGSDLPALAVRVQRDLAFAGEQDGQVEVYQAGSELPVYHRLARSSAALLWAAAPEREIRVARVFDEVTPETGPRFHAGHPRLPDAGERGRILGYLSGGTPVLVTAARMDDVVDPTKAAVVPMTFRTDGSWIWTDSVAYYLREYELSPEEDLLTHIRQAQYRVPTVDGPAMHRVLAVLMEPPADEVAWTVGDVPGNGDDLLDGEIDDYPDDYPSGRRT
ncbi:hypothetical protein [Frankia sp. CiP3]|uniref:hypothetical protein n=1 Tax=Frankia sp. CiP3 TaxID=2880971 RepID=UPI001EF6D759|nr:hypothetical protein [Frankia sp. CiP3]